jgi:aspartyl protease family protein
MLEILAACALLAALAVLAPAHLTSVLKSWDAPPAAPQSGARQPSRPRMDARLEVRAAANGHFYVSARVNGAPISIMVDTGASYVALRQSDAEAAGIRVFPGDFNVPLATANAIVYAASVEIDQLAVAGIEVDRVAAVVLPDDRLGTSLLGNSFLGRLERFEIAGDRLIFEN